MGLKAKIFPADFDEEITTGLLRELSRSGLVALYRVGGLEYLQVTGWNHQRIEKMQPLKYPIPQPIDFIKDDEPLREDYGTTTGGLPPDRIGKDRIGKDTITGAPNGASFGCQDWPSNYEQLFWIKYPHKVGKRAAMKALTSVRRRSKIPWAEFMAALDAYIANKPAERHWCNPATWLNQDRFEDRPGPPPVVIQTPKERMSDVLQQLGSGNFGQDLDIGLPKLVSK